MKPTLFFALALSILLPTRLVASDEPGVVGLRAPKYPLKTSRRIFSEADLAQLHENIAAHKTAKAIADTHIKRASPWLERSDEDLLRLIPTAAVPRAFNVGTAGSPTVGKKIYEKGGTYPWKLDIDDQFKVTCPVNGEVFPDNDFDSYYQSGLTDKSFLEGEYADDGWGWVGPDGERYWFVAYANHWNWQKTILPGVRYLSRAYLVTGDKRFAHKAAVMLYRIAQVYPGMDYHDQSRYGQKQGELGSRYEGKILNRIWETGVLQKLAEAYDSVWETIDEDKALQDLVGLSGKKIRAHIEANLLEEGIEEVFNKKIEGNYGMHQKALAFAALARDGGPVDEWLDGLLNGIAKDTRHLGVNYALYNLIYRDGFPYETSPGYNFSWVRNLTEVANTLQKADRDPYANRRFKRLYDAVTEIVNIDTHTPALGDSGSVYGGLVGRDALAYQSAYRAYGDPKFARFLDSLGKTGPAGFSDFETLLYPPIPEASGEGTPASSRLLDGYGMGILNNPNDTNSVSITYGYKGGHGHFDRLHFDLFANGLAMTPDLGYPDFMNAYVPGIFSWSKNTISHNTVTVDASRQPKNEHGTVTLFADGPFARVVEIDAAGTYPQCSTYRRTLVMVDVDDERSYWVDLFDVAGGGQHDYSLHGPPGEFEIVSGEWSEPAPGTLAGEDVQVGELYDNAVLAATGYTGSYGGYVGSGFQHFVNVRDLEEGAPVLEWRHEKDNEAGLRVHLQPTEGRRTMIANAQVSPVKHKQELHYVLAREEGEGLSSRFVSVLEPFSGKPSIEDVKWVASEEETARVDVRIDGNRTDRISVSRRDGNPVVVVSRYDAADKRLGLFSAGFGSTEGVVTNVDPETNRITIRPGDSDTESVSERWVGRISHFSNDSRRTAHPVEEADVVGEEIRLHTRDDLLVGRPHLVAIESATLTTSARFQFAPCYRGAYLTDASFSRFFPIREATADQIYLEKDLPEDHPFKLNEDAWIVNVGPGDRVEVPTVRTE